MRRSLGPRKQVSNLSDSLHERLNAYALAASAAGVSCLALSYPCDAEIVHKKLNVYLEGNSIYYFNPANQSVAPLMFLNQFVANTTYWWNNDFVLPNSQLKDKRDTGALLARNSFPADLKESAAIGKKGVFGPGHYFLFTYGPYGGGTYKHHEGNFPFGKRGYLGFKFYIAGKAHFGWVRLKITASQDISLTHLLDYAYETIAGKPIKAGQTNDADDSAGRPSAASLTAPDTTCQPATLGILAAGASVLSIWRH